MPRESDLEIQQNLIVGLPSTGLGEIEIPPLEGKTKSCTHQDPEERSTDAAGDPARPASAGGSSVEALVGIGSSQGQGNW